MLIAEINDDCILGVDFFKLLNLQNIFDCIFLESVSVCIDTDFKCARVKNIAVAGVPSNLGGTSNREFFAICHTY